MNTIEQSVSDRRTDALHNLRVWAVTGLVIAIALLFAISYWVSRERSARDSLATAVESQSHLAGVLLQQQFRSLELIIRSAQGFLESSTDLTARSFRNFSRSLDLDQVGLGLQGLGFAAYFAGDDARERAERALTNYRDGQRHVVTPPGSRSVYAPVVVIEPLDRNKALIGFDALSSSATRAVLEVSRDSVALVASDTPVLSPDETGAPLYDDFAFYLPVYSPVQNDQLPGEREGALKGWVTMSFRLSDMLSHVAAGLENGLQLQVLNKDGQPIVLETLEDAHISSVEEAFVSSLGVLDALEFGGRSWEFRVEPTSLFLKKHRQNAHHWITTIAVLLSLALGWIVYLRLTLRDRANELALQMTAHLRSSITDLNDTLDAMPDVLFEMDRKARYLALHTSNKACLHMPEGKLLGRSVWDVLSPDAARTVQFAIDEAATQGRSMGATFSVATELGIRHFELSVARKSVSFEGHARFIVLARDITDRLLAETQAFQVAYFDTLSGLTNRGQFLAEAPTRIDACLASSHIAAVVLINLDSFKLLNDQGGYSYGDACIAEIARRLCAVLGETVMVARFCGDEFVLLLTGLGKTMEEAIQTSEAICARLLVATSAAMAVGRRETVVTASIGVSFAGPDDLSLDDLIRGAEFAMYQAKRGGGDAYRFFDRQLQRRVAERIVLEQDMRSGLGAGEFYLVYQPQVDASGRVLGAEALCRWEHPRKGRLSPDLFIDLAERSGFIKTLGLWVMQRACETLVVWQKDPVMANLRIAVNVSARQFHHPDFVLQVRNILEKTGVAAELLELELTESTLAYDVDGVIQKMVELRGMGLRFSLDDFGTGYSSLSYLKRLPLHQLKIDQSFVRDVLADKSSASIVCTVIALSVSLDLEVIAEGVETVEQRQFLLDNGCRQFQGYLFSRPLLADEMQAYMNSMA